MKPIVRKVARGRGGERPQHPSYPTWQVFPETQVRSPTLTAVPKVSGKLASPILSLFCLLLVIHSVTQSFFFSNLWFLSLSIRWPPRGQEPLTTTEGPPWLGWPPFLAV